MFNLNSSQTNIKGETINITLKFLQKELLIQSYLHYVWVIKVVSWVVWIQSKKGMTLNLFGISTY